MRDPTTTTDPVVKELTEITFQYLCQRDLLETNEAINAHWAWAKKQIRLWGLGRDPGWCPPARKRGRPPQQRDRHLQIAGAVALLVEVAGLNPTRSHSERRLRSPSACSIVTTALEWWGEHLDERTVEGIWNRYRQSPRIIHLDSITYARNHYVRTRS